MQLKTWKKRRKDVAGLERSIKDEKVHTELWWHARRRRRRRRRKKKNKNFLCLSPSYMTKLRPSYHHF
jgi:hypothetical protein